MRILSTHHVALHTPNFDRLRDFYAETLGLPIVGGFPGRDIVFISAGSTTIELIGQEDPLDGAGQSGWTHLAWEVEDVDETYAELSARGVRFHVCPEGFPDDAPTMRIAFFKDPDGNDLELVQPLGSCYPLGSATGDSH